MKRIKCIDKFYEEIKEGDSLDVQNDGVHKVYKKDDNQLYFKPYGKEDRVSAYFSNDMVVVTEENKYCECKDTEVEEVYSSTCEICGKEK
jgi:hypothetical protein